MDFRSELSNMIAGFYKPSDEQVEDAEILQRSDEWHEARRGKFTGSKLNALMTTKGRSTKANPKNWGSKFWLTSFGDTATTYIKQQSFERASGECIETFDIPAFKWGREQEPIGKAAVEELLNITISECEFIEFQKGAGASPDGVLSTSEGFELKCPQTVHSHYDLGAKPVVEGHDYFWQITGEMIALKTDKLLFATFHPKYPEASRIKHQWVRLSQEHYVALKLRCWIADRVADVVAKAMVDGDNFPDVRGVIELVSEEVPEEYNDICNFVEGLV